MAFGIQVNGDDVDLQPQTSIVIEENEGPLRGKVISENEDRDIGIENISGLNISHAVSNYGIIVFNSDRDVTASSIFNFVSLLEVKEVDLVDIYDDDSMEFTIPSHTYKGVVGIPKEIVSFTITDSTAGYSTINTSYTGGFSVDKVDPFDADKYNIVYSGDKNASVRAYLDDIGTTSVVVGELPNDITDADGNATPVLSSTSVSSTFTEDDFSSVTFTLSAGSGVLTWSVSPSLPEGLSLNTSTGVISGTPIATQDATSYTISVSNIEGSDSLTWSLTVVAAPEFLTLPAALTKLSEVNSSIFYFDYTVPAGTTTIPFGVYASDDIFASNDATVNAGPYPVRCGDDLFVSDGADVVFNMQGGRFDIGDNTTVADNCKLTVNSANEFIRFGDDLTLSGNSEVIIYNTNDYIRIVDNLTCSNRSKLRMQTTDSYIVIGDDITVSNDAEARIVSESSYATVSDKITISGNGVLRITADDNVRVDDDVTLSGNGSLIITSDNGDVILSNELTAGSDTSVALSAPNGTVTIDGVNHGTSYTS